MKRIICVLSLLVMLSSCAVMSLKNGNVGLESVEAKNALAEKYADEYVKGYKFTEAGKERKKQVVDLVCKIQTNLIDSTEACRTLETLGVYKFDTEVKESESNDFSKCKYIEMSQIAVFYDAYNMEWLICGGGWWTDDSVWKDQMPEYYEPNFDAGTEFESAITIGSDLIGIKLYNTNECNTRIKERYTYNSNGVSVYSPSESDGSYGRLESVINNVRVTGTIGGEKYNSCTYDGKHFAALLVYDSEFANFTGYAGTHYVHTWADAQIESYFSGIKNTEPKFQVKILNAEHSVQCYSKGQTIF